MKIGVMWTHTSQCCRYKKFDQNDTDDKEENSEAPPSSKEIVDALSVLRRAVQNRVDEKCFDRNIILTKSWS